MLSERIVTLYELLQCNNTDIARFAHCSSGNISRLKSGQREPKPTSRTIAAFVHGVYGYADYENLLSVLCELCGAESTEREALLPALVSWLYGSSEAALPRPVAPRSKRTERLRRQNFGERLSRAMGLLELNNGQLSALLSVDASLISRWRGGVYSPRTNGQLSEALSAALLARAQRMGKAAELARLCGAETEEADVSAVGAWLFDAPEEEPTRFAQLLIRSVDDFTPGQAFPAAPEAAPIEIAEKYHGSAGLRSAVLRFLTDAANEGGELLLYSDEPMDWLSGDRSFFVLWASLMMQCVNRGVHIRIIHNLNRGASEMATAISGWFPLYISGRIEPYVFRREASARFCHTVFLRAGAACIHGFFPIGAGEGRRYEYITDAAELDELAREYDAMLSSSEPFLKTYTAAMRGEYLARRLKRGGDRDCLVTAPPLFTMPEPLFARILSRAEVTEERRAEIFASFRTMRGQFLESLQTNCFRLLLCPADDGGLVDFSLELMEPVVRYTREEYAEHLAELRRLVETERNFHLTLLPFAPFRDVELITTEDTVAMLRRCEPHAAFVFTNAMLTRSMSEYFDSLIRQYDAERAATAAALDRLMRG